LLVVVLAVAGCGLQTEEANKDLAQATKHQDEAEATLARLRAFPAEWETLFDVAKVGPDQVNRARELVSAREKDVDALEQALEEWEKDLGLIEKLNVEGKIKEYVRLKMNAVKSWQDYTSLNLRPLIKAYGGMLDIIAFGRPPAEQSAKAQEITSLVAESVQKLEECRNSEKQADKYFQENKLGK
jgi:hypothetical protein